MDRFEKIRRVGAIALAGLLGFDLVTDVAISEIQDGKDLVQAESPVEPEDPQAAAEITSEKEKGRLWRSLTTVGKAIAVAIAFAAGIGSRPELPKRVTPPDVVVTAPAEISRSRTISEFDRVYRKFSVVIEAGAESIINDDVIDVLNSRSDDMKTLLEDNVLGEKLIVNALGIQIESIEFRRIEDGVMLTIDVSTNRLNSITDALEAAIKIVKDACEDLMEEKLEAIAEKLGETPDFQEATDSVVTKQMNDRKQRTEFPR